MIDEPDTGRPDGTGTGHQPELSASPGRPPGRGPRRRRPAPLLAERPERSGSPEEQEPRESDNRFVAADGATERTERLRPLPEGTAPDAPADTQRDLHRDAPRDMHRDAPRDMHRDAPRDRQREMPRDGHRDARRDGHRDGYRDAQRDAGRDGYRDTQRDGGRDAQRDSRPTGDDGTLGRAIQAYARARWDGPSSSAATVAELGGVLAPELRDRVDALGLDCRRLLPLHAREVMGCIARLEHEARAEDARVAAKVGQLRTRELGSGDDGDHRPNRFGQGRGNLHRAKFRGNQRQK